MRAALAEVGEDSSEASEIDAVARWCDGLADDLRQRVDFVVWVDRSLAFSGLASIRGGVARGVLPLGGLPSHLDGEVPTTRAGFQAQAAERAGFDLAAYDPADGFPANEGNVLAIYDYYLEVYETNERFRWAAMARLAGSNVFAGLQDLDTVSSTPLYPAPWLTERLMHMQRDIFRDLAWQHEAYLTGGLEPLEEAVERGHIDRRTLTAWRHLDSGEPERVAEAARLLVYREQRDVLQADHYDRWPEHAPDLAGMTSRNGDSPVPGGRPFAEVVDPLVEGEPQLHDWGHRRAWIDADMLPAVQRFLDRDDAAQVLATPVPERAEQFRHFGVQLLEDQPVVPPTLPGRGLAEWLGPRLPDGD